MDIKIAQRVYILTEEYVNKDGKTAVAKVKLNVDENNGTFEVVPGDGGDSFCFKSRMKGDYNMWVAVSKLAYMAVEFGQKQITKEEEVNKNVD